MSHSTRTPYFPANLEDCAPWVSTYGLLAPYGKCQCGCEQDAPRARQTDRSLGHIKGGPLRFIKQHRSRLMPSATIEERFRRHFIQGSVDECWSWHGTLDVDGYGKIWNGSSLNISVHRLSWKIHNGPIPEGMCVCHRCDINYPVGDITYRRCVNPHHLFLGTNIENTADKVAKKRQACGEAIRMGKLVEADVVEIRALFQSGMYQWQIAQMFGIRQSHVSRIIRRESWSHV